MNRKSIRAYQDKEVGDDLIEATVRAGQQAPFAYQLCSLLLSRKREENPFGAPLLFTICADSHRLEVVMAQRDWKMIQSDLSLLLFGIQDASLMAQNMVIAAESLGLGSCFLGGVLPIEPRRSSRSTSCPSGSFHWCNWLWAIQQKIRQPVLAILLISICLGVNILNLAIN